MYTLVRGHTEGQSFCDPVRSVLTGIGIAKWSSLKIGAMR